MRLFSALMVLFLFILASPVKADYGSSYDQYRTTHSDYQVAKSAYGTYKTLIAREEAVKRMRLVLKARDDLSAAYFDMVFTRVPASYKDTFSKIRDSEKTWLTDHQKKIDAAAALEDLNAVSKEYEGRYPQMDSETKQAIVMLLLDKQSLLFARWETLAAAVSDNINRVSLEGGDVGLGERGVVSARNKKELAMAKMVLAAKTPTDLFAAQQRLTESKQYLREGTDYLNEVLRAVTGQ